MLRHVVLSALALCALSTTAAAAAPRATMIARRRLLEPGDAAAAHWKQAGDCPRRLEEEGEGGFAAPDYMTRVSAREPGRAFGPQYEGAFTPGDLATVYGFRVPAARRGERCALEFLFPRRDQVEATSWLEYRGAGTFVFSLVAAGPGACPGPGTTFDDIFSATTADEPTAFPPVHMEPGNAYAIDVGPCAPLAGKCVAGGE